MMFSTKVKSASLRVHQNLFPFTFEGEALKIKSTMAMPLLSLSACFSHFYFPVSGPTQALALLSCKLAESKEKPHEFFQLY